jgi:hypothetical protein
VHGVVVKRSVKHAICVGAAWLALVSSFPVSAQQKAASPQGAPAVAAPVVMPQAETIVILIRNALLALNLANQTGNYTVLRDMAAPSFRDANSAARLGQIFQALREQGLDLSPVAIVPPQISEAPTIDAGGLLRLTGYFPTQPLQVNFQLKFQPVSGRWQLFEMTVSATAAPLPAPAPGAVAPAPAGGKEPAKKK